MKRNKALAALLLVIFLAALAACSDEQAAEEDFKFMQGERIRQADVDYFHKLALDEANDILEIDAVYALAMQRAVLLEAESQELAVSWEDAMAHAEEQYQQIQANAQNENSPEYETAKWQWEQIQELMQSVPMTESEYLEANAVTWQFTEAYRVLQEQFVAELPAEVREDVWARSDAVYKYVTKLVEKYRDDLVEDDLRPMLDGYLQTLLLDIEQNNG